MKKVNKNAVSIYENKDKFVVGESYSYKDICSICDIKEYNSGDSRKKQLDTFKELFNVEEYKVARTTMYKIISVKELSEEESTELVANKRGTNVNSHGNRKAEYSADIVDSLLANLYLKSLEDREDNLKIYEHIDDRYFKIITDKFDLSCLIGIRNRENFKNARLNKFDFCDNAKINIKSFEHIYPSTNDAIYRATSYVLSLLQNSGHVNIRETMRVLVPKFKDEEGYVLDDEEIDNMILEEYNAEEVDKYLIDKIKCLRGEVANKMGYTSLKKIYNSSDQSIIDTFNRMLEETVKEKLNVHKFYPKIELILNKESVLNYFLDKDMNLYDISKIGTEKFIQHRIDKMLLEKNIINSEEKIQKKLDNISKKHNTENPFFYYDKVQLNKYYDKDLNKLSNLLIDPNQKTIEVSKELRETKQIKKTKRKYTRSGFTEQTKTKYVLSDKDLEEIENLKKI